MERARICKNEFGGVTLRAPHPVWDEEIEWEFEIPTRGGYIRRDGRQVCEGLADRGRCLEADDQDDLLKVIRQEWRKFVRAIRREADGWS